jgi:outer membrane putative beta-barrel porin/alpha-amylase
MELATPGEGKWFVASTYDFHDASKLVSGSSSVPNSTGRDRTSSILMLEPSRRLDDAMVILEYSPVTISVFSRNAFSLGLGAQLPIGEDDARSGSIMLAEDMQPSTGAFGSIIWMYAARTLNEPATTRLYANASYTNNGENDRDYQFAHEVRASLGFRYKTQSPWGFNVEMSYRQTKRDKRASTSIPNTGGEWLEIIPAVQCNLNDSMAVRASVTQNK